MIHVCEGLGLLARCTAAHCRHCAAAPAAPVIMTGLTRSLPLTCDGYVVGFFWCVSFFFCESVRERWTLRERWIDRQGEKRVRVKVHAEHMLVA